jgi:xylulokinase
MLGGVSSTSGAALLWAYENISRGPAQGESFEAFVTEALAIAPGAEGLTFVPYLAGERSPYWNDTIRGGFYGLRLSHDHRHFARAVMEGVAYSLRHLLDIFGELGAPVDEIALAGGGTRTEGWPQMFADVCQRPVAIYAGQETVTRVLYALCQSCLGVSTFEDSLAATFDEPHCFANRGELADVYETGYRAYRSLARYAIEQAAGAS